MQRGARRSPTATSSCTRSSRPAATTRSSSPTTQLAQAPLRLPVARVPRLVREAARGAAHGDGGALGPAAGRPVRRRRRLRDRGAVAGQRGPRHPAAARLRRRPGRDLPRPRAAARPTTTSRATAGWTACGAPTRSSTSASTGRSSGCRARCSRSRAGCAPDAALGDVPLVYPFVVNDPGEGVQAKRRAHAAIVDHLVPPMMRAETYDELAELETLLDDYARARGARPAPSCRRWRRASGRPSSAANLQADLGVDRARPTTSAPSSGTSTATCARSRTSRSRTGCTCSAARPRASSCAGW